MSASKPVIHSSRFGEKDPLPEFTSTGPLAEIPEFAWLPGGEFWMGQEDGRDEERPVHRVRVGPFGLGRFQVTNKQYQEFCRDTGRRPTKFQHKEHFNRPTQPVTGVSWFDAVDYCEWLSARTAKRFRLPTEAEWEWAARGGLESRHYPWGNQPVTERDNYSDRWRNGPEAVGTSASNGFHLYDMCENVHEWCWDWYDGTYYSYSPNDNPKGPESGARRASRGGAWRHQIKIARCAARSSIPPEFEYADYGFRVACDAIAA